MPYKLTAMKAKLYEKKFLAAMCVVFFLYYPLTYTLNGIQRVGKNVEMKTVRIKL